MVTKCCRDAASPKKKASPLRGRLELGGWFPVSLSRDRGEGVSYAGAYAATLRSWPGSPESMTCWPRARWRCTQSRSISALVWSIAGT